MRHGPFDVIAPRLLGENLNEAEALGSAVWLWMHSRPHRSAPLRLLSTLLLPAIKSGQFVIASESGKPVFYMSWAALDAGAERRYVQNPPECMAPEDWASGDRLWILDWVAPFGHTAAMRRLVATRLFPGACVRALNHRGEKTGLRAMAFRGAAVTAAEARHWFTHHPLELDLR